MKLLSIAQKSEWWQDFLQEWNYLVYTRARRLAWITLIYPIVAIPTLWTIRQRIKLDENILSPFILTFLVLTMFGVSAYLLFGYKTARSVEALTAKHIRITVIYIFSLVVILNAVFAIVWRFYGLNSPYLIGLPILSILFLRITKTSLFFYGLNALFYFVYISLFEFPPAYISVAYISGAIATILGIIIANSLYTLRVKEFIDRRTIEQQKLELTNTYFDIAKLNDKLRDDNLRMGVELSIAKQIQEVILPKKPELDRISFLDVAALMSSATEVGGDYFDVLVDHDQTRATIAIGDVTGHGLESGIFTIMLQSAVRLFHHSNKYSLVEAINLLNCLIYENARRMESDKCVTFVLLKYDRGKIQICGQHEDIILVRNTGNLETIDTASLGFPLGLEYDISAFVRQREIHLNYGDVLVLYTDGITEAINNEKEIYGISRLQQTIVKNYHRSAEEIRQNITEDVMDFIGAAPINDDITLVVVKQI